MFGLFNKGSEPAKHARTAREFFKACNVYCRPEADQVIVASVFNHGGLMAEKPGGSTIARFSDSAALNAAVRDALEACEYNEQFNYSDQRKSDWPAYQASGYKTMKRFEAEFIRLLVKGVNEKNFFYDVISPEFGEYGLHLTVTVEAYSGDHGQAIQHIVKSYVMCKAAIAP